MIYFFLSFFFFFGGGGGGGGAQAEVNIYTVDLPVFSLVTCPDINLWGWQDVKIQLLTS